MTEDAAADPTRSLRIAHLTTIDMSLLLLLGTELETDLQAGHVTFGISAPGSYVERVQALGVTHVPIPQLSRSWGPAQDLAAFRRLLTTLQSLRLDVLHTHNPKTGVMGRVAGRLAGVPVVVNTCHGLWAGPEDRLRKRAFVYGLEALAARFSDYELFQNAQDRDTLRRALKRGRHRVVGNGVDLTRFAPDEDGRRQVRRELGVGDDELLVGTVGRRVREKGLVEFGEAAASLRDRATFVWVGPEDATDPERPDGLDAVRFVDERTDMAAVYSALDVFVLASHREGFSRAAMEAAACGRAMVLTDIRGCREIGSDGEHLLLAPSHDGGALAQRVERLLADPALRERLGAGARRRAHEEFDQRAVARASLDTYAEVARQKNVAVAAHRDGRTTVLHILPSDLDRGAQVYAGRLRDALADDSTQRHLVVSLFDAPEAALGADLRLGVPPGLMRRLGLDVRAVLALRRALRRERAGVVVAHGGEPLKYVVAAARRTPIVYYKIGLSSAEIQRSSRRRLYRALAARVTRVVGVSQAIVDQAHELLDVPRAKMSLIPNGRDPERYHPPLGDEHRVKPPRVLFVGRLEPGKRPGLFLDVIEALRSRGIAFDAAIVGDGPLRTTVEGRAAVLDVEMMGVRSDVPDLLRRSALLLLTSESATEGMPGVLIEAGLSGVPVVATAAAGVNDVVADGLTGFVVASDDPDELADRVERLLRDEGLRADLGGAARHRCEARFALDVTAHLWHDLVQEVVTVSPAWRYPVHPPSRK